MTLYWPEKETVGKKVKVLVSNEFYSVQEGKPFFAGKGDNEIWVLLIEKAVASLLGGYSIFEKDGYGLNVILSVLTGQPSPQEKLSVMGLEKFKDWLKTNKDKVITISDKKHAYSITSVDLEGDNITLTEPQSLHTFNYSVEAIIRDNLFEMVAACALTKDKGCPAGQTHLNAYCQF